MDKDVEGKLGRLCDQYARAQAKVEKSKPTKLPHNRSRRQAEGRVMETLKSLGTSRQSLCSSMVRLAYVRGLRQQDPKGRLGEEEQGEVEELTRRLGAKLRALDEQVFLSFRRHISHLITAQTIRNTGAGEHIAAIVENAGAPVPMEQRARACATSILEEAEIAGRLAGTSAGNYDGAPNVH